MTSHEAATILEDAKQAIEAQLKLVKDCLNRADIEPIICNRAEAYWLAHIEAALSRERDYLGGSIVTMSDTIDELFNGIDNEDDDD